MESRRDRRVVGHHLGLRELKGQPFRPQAAVAQDARDVVHEVGRQQLAQGDVDVDRWLVSVGSHPCDRGPACLPQHPPADRHDQPRFLRQCQERGWGARPDGMVPAEERLETHDVTTRHVGDRLVAERELAAPDGLAQVVPESLALRDGLELGSNTANRALPRLLAAYMATSASCSRASAVWRRVRAAAMPTLALTDTQLPSISTGRPTVSMTRSAIG